jgi:hypothetical protein
MIPPCEFVLQSCARTPDTWNDFGCTCRVASSMLSTLVLLLITIVFAQVYYAISSVINMLA